MKPHWLYLLSFLFLAPSVHADDKLLSVVDPAAIVREGPPEFKPTKARFLYGTQVKVLEEKVADGKAYVHAASLPGETVKGWTLKSNLGSVKEFDQSMRAKESIVLEELKGLELRMACLFNARGKYLHTKATSLGAKPADLAAVLQIESGGRGYNNDGRLIIRFENHIFDNRWGKQHADSFAKHFKYDPAQKWLGHEWRKTDSGDWVKCHQNQDGEWAVLSFAKSLDENAALESASFGMPQIMGFNHKTVGFKSAAEMVKAFDGGIQAQLDAFIAFIESNKNCKDGLKSSDYVQFAKGYNGTAKAEAYGKKIQEAAEAYTKVTKGKAAE